MSHWELKPKGTQTWVECLNEWSDKVGARINWECSLTQSSSQAWRATPIIDGATMSRFTGEGTSKDAAKNAAAFALNKAHVLWRRN
ncbi:unnamed protein product [Rhizoctonia solani]|uniref:DRBM domain-containing protein n=1 Tax=Rhizoctonia solani TaxID=456999 RepID=A0A8H3BWZ4_9AGAM|nr:unnamed protein product [Rhizoctonia solani]